MLKNKCRGKFLAYFIILNLLVSGFTGTLLYSYSSSILQKKSINTTQNMMVQLDKATNLLLNQVENYLTSLAFDTDVINLMQYYRNNDILTINKVNDNENNLLMLNNYIQSISVYYRNENMVYWVNNGMFALEDFEDKEFVKSIGNNSISYRNLHSRTIKDKFNNTANVISVIKPIPQNGTNPIAFAIVNIDEQYFTNIMNSLLENKGQEIYITNMNGGIISRNNMYTGKYEALLKSDILKESAEDFVANKVLTFNKEKLLISRAVSQRYGWEYVSIIPFKSIIGEANFIKYWSMFIVLLALVIGLIISLFFTAKLSKPINSIVGLFKDQSEQAINEDVFKYIENKVTNLVYINESIEKTLAENMPILRSNYLVSLLKGKAQDIEEIKNRFNYYNIDFYSEGNYLVYIISIDNYESLNATYSEYEINMFIISMIDTIGNIVNKDNKGIVINTHSDELAVVLAMPEDMEDTVRKKERIESLGVQIRNAVLESGSYIATVAVGSMCNKLDEISKSYKDALQALKFRHIMGNNNILFYEDVKNMKEESFNYPFDKEDELLTFLRNGDITSVIAYNKELFAMLMNIKKGNIEHFYYYMQLLSSTIKCINELGINAEAIFENRNLYKEILSCSSTAVVQEWFEKLFTNIVEILEFRKDNKNKIVIDSVKEYINKNYNQDLSLTILSQQFYISSPYLSKIFKECTGISLKQYTSEIRVQKAKEFLKNPSFKIAEVGEMVGYDKVHGFLKMFKEATCMTPGEYRTSICLRAEDGE
jgi:AraC-like DNA-binding protein/type III secretory pathway component EscS